MFLQDLEEEKQKIKNPRICVICGKEFENKYGNRYFPNSCSKECRAKLISLRKNELVKLR